MTQEEESCTTISRAMRHYRNPDRARWTLCGSSAQRLRTDEADLPVCANCIKARRKRRSE